MPCSSLKPAMHCMHRRLRLRFDPRAIIYLFAAALLSLLQPSAIAQNTAAPDARAVPATPARLTFENREIFEFRTSVEGFAPAERVHGARTRLEMVSRRGG